MPHHGKIKMSARREREIEYMKKNLFVKKV
jgi:hypothetical protein